MRPIQKPQSALWAPLNSVFGTEANVRIMRAIALSPMPLTSGEIARTAGLQPSGVRRALDRLVDTGVVVRVGFGKRRLVQLARKHPLASPIREIFAAEKERAENLFAAIQQQAATLSPPPHSVWVYGNLARSADELGDSVKVALVADASHLYCLARALRTGLAPVESALDVTFEIRILTVADLVLIADDPDEDLLVAIPLFGPEPKGLLRH